MSSKNIFQEYTFQKKRYAEFRLDFNWFELQN